jgi:L-fucose mutarotase/ribose pyranase (RbsD/FucU family)
MLTTINPILAAELVTALGRLRPGEQLLLTNTHFSTGERVVNTGTDLVQVVDAILTLVPLAAPHQAPLQGWLADPADEDAYDLAFTVQGMAADATHKPLRMMLLTDNDAPTACQAATVHLHLPVAGTGWAFLLRARG